MQKENFFKNEPLKMMGLSVRTNNRECFEPSANKISPLITQYWQESIATRIPNRKNPGVTLAVYTDYDSDEHGDYTYFYGEEVSSFDGCPADLKSCTIQPGKCVRFTPSTDKMPDVVINAWMKIWQMAPPELGGQRSFQADWEVYDQRATDPEAATVDIFLGLK